MSGILLAATGALFVAPFIWSALVALARRGVTGPLDDRHEKALLALMLAPVIVGAVLLLLPRATISATAPPLLDWVELPSLAVANEAVTGEAARTLDRALFAGAVLLALYLIGVVRHAIPLIVAHIRLNRWIAAAHPYPDLGVYVSESAATPLAVSKRRVLFPRRLIETLSPSQIRLIVDHERHHHARGDVAFYAWLAWIDVLFWFNPFVRAQTQNCRLAAELDCDAAVTAAAPEMRRTYAETLLTVLKHAAGNALPCAPAVFSHRAIGEHHMRIVQIMKRQTDARKRAPWLAYVAALALAAPFAAAQLALAQSTAPSAISDDAAANTPAFTHVPLDGRLTASFGERRDPFTGNTALHAGIDIAAENGSPIVAPADGVVMRLARNHQGYGNYMEIDHGDGFVLRYAQLSAFEVGEGDRVRAGEVIARVGQSGRATGPHLHLEVWRGETVWDPALFLDLPAVR